MSQNGVLGWSQTAASNASADPSVNWAEGMAPSAVNDSARAMMASVAKWRDDISGAIVTTGTSTAYAVTSHQVEAALTAGYVIAFNPHATNGGACTLNVDGLGAKPLRSAPGVDLAAGVLVQGTPYAAVYFSANSGEWILQGLYGNPYGVPIGGGLIYVGSSAPNSSFALPYGQAVSRTTYSALFALAGTAFGSGDGSTTFNIPDLRGRAVFGPDNMGGSAAGRVTTAGSGIDGETKGANGGEQAHTLTTAELASHSHGVTDPGHTHKSAYSLGINAAGSGGTAVINYSAGPSTTASSVEMTGISVNNAGSGNAHNNMPPSLIMPYIIRLI